MESPSETQRGKVEPWKVDEVIALAKTWVDISEDAVHGNDQETQVFQERIWKLWCQRMGRTYYTHQSIYSKWRGVSKIAKAFEAIFAQCKRNWPSGANIDDVMLAARQQYIDKNGTKNPFNAHAEAFWRVIRDNEKWREQTSFHQFDVGINATKRFKSSTSTHSQSSDANVGFDINQEREADVLPIDRDQAKRKMKGGSSGTNSSAELQQLNEQVATLQTLHEEKVKTKLMDIVTRNISDLRRFEYQIALQAKKDAARKLGYTFDDE